MAQLEWQTVKEYEEITFKQLNGVARIAFNVLRCATRLLQRP